MPKYLYTVTVARRSWAEANQDKLVRYTRAVAAAFKYIRDPNNRANVVKTIVDTTGFAEENAKLTLELYFEPDRNVLPQAGEISIKGMQQAIALLRKAESSSLRCRHPSASSTCAICRPPGFSNTKSSWPGLARRRRA